VMIGTAITFGEIAEWVLIVGATILFVANRVRRFKALRRRKR
jgi:hypothetical protein